MGLSGILIEYSGIIFVSVVLGILLWSLYAKFKKPRCKVCKRGLMQRVKATPQGTMQHTEASHSNDGDHYSTLKVKMLVKYQCTHCQAFYETVEYR